MSGAGAPPGGYRWVDSSGSSGPVAQCRRRRWWVGAAVVVAVLIAVVAWWMWRPGTGEGHGGQATAGRSAPPLGTPKELLIGFPLNRPLTTVWQSKAAELGLPADAPLGDLFASTGDKAYFLSQFVDLHCSGRCRPQAAWVYGVDTRTGARLFNPVQLPNYQFAVTCFGNGPTTAVCLKADPPLTAWVIDLDQGKLTFTGPTDVAYSAYAGQPEAHPVGTSVGQSRLVSTVRGKGVYGMGSHTERTWFVPGNGFLSPGDNEVADDIPATPIAVSTGGGNDSDRVFSVIDGTDLTPAPPAGAALSRAVVYNGGFAYAYQNPGTRATGVRFYDTKGTLISDRPFGTSFVKLLNNPAMPIIAADGTFQVYTADGRQLSQFAAPEVAPDLRTIGTKLYVNIGEPSQKRWQQFDLMTGQPGPTCTGWQLKGTGPSGGGTYVASDGANILTETEELSGQFEVTDAATCQVLWRTPADAKLQIWKVGTGLLQIEKGSNVMTWLRPPA